jgi:hypothetical protein
MQRSIKCENEVHSLSFARSDTVFAGVKDCYVASFSVEDGTLLKKYAPHPNTLYVRGLAVLSQTGGLVATSCCC